MNIILKILYLIFFVLLILVLLKFFLSALLIALVLLWLRTWQIKKEPNQQDFSAGKLPNPGLSGQYQGSMGFDVSWIGKKMDRESATGINIFKDKHGNTTENYPFKTYTGKGLFDENVFVLKLDYNVKGNPFWVRWIVDEVVQIGPDEYLGKMHLKIIPGFPFSVLYFTLKK